MWTAIIQISLGISVIWSGPAGTQRWGNSRINVDATSLHRRWCEVVWTPCARRGGVPWEGGTFHARLQNLFLQSVFKERDYLRFWSLSKKKKSTENLSCFIIYVEKKKKEIEWKNKKRKEKKEITSNFKVNGFSSVNYFFSLSVDVFASLGISFLLAALSWKCFLCVTNSSWKFIDTTALLLQIFIKIVY